MAGSVDVACGAIREECGTMLPTLRTTSIAWSVPRAFTNSPACFYLPMNMSPTLVRMKAVGSMRESTQVKSTAVGCGLSRT